MKRLLSAFGAIAFMLLLGNSCAPQEPSKRVVSFWVCIEVATSPHNNNAYSTATIVEEFSDSVAVTILDESRPRFTEIAATIAELRNSIPPIQLEAILDSSYYGTYLDMNWATGTIEEFKVVYGADLFEPEVFGELEHLFENDQFRLTFDGNTNLVEINSNSIFYKRRSQISLTSDTLISLQYIDSQGMYYIEEFRRNFKKLKVQIVPGPNFKSRQEFVQDRISRGLHSFSPKYNNWEPMWNHEDFDSGRTRILDR